MENEYESSWKMYGNEYGLQDAESMIYKCFTKSDVSQIKVDFIARYLQPFYFTFIITNGITILHILQG